MTGPGRPALSVIGGKPWQDSIARRTEFERANPDARITFDPAKNYQWSGTMVIEGKDVKFGDFIFLDGLLDVLEPAALRRRLDAFEGIAALRKEYAGRYRVWFDWTYWAQRIGDKPGEPFSAPTAAALGQAVYAEVHQPTPLTERAIQLHIAADLGNEFHYPVAADCCCGCDQKLILNTPGGTWRHATEADW